MCPSSGLFKQASKSLKPKQGLISTETANSTEMASRALCFFALLSLSAVLCFAESNEEDPGLVMNFYSDSCPQAEDIVREQVKLLYKRHKNTAFSWLRNIFHDCAVQVHKLLSISHYFSFLWLFGG